MIRFLTAIIFFSTISIQAFCRQPIVLTDATSLISIGRQIDLLEDKTERLSLQQILSPEYQLQFKQSTQEVPNFGTKQTSVWCRIRIKNLSHKDWIFNVDFPNLHSVILFQPVNYNYTREETGRSFPFSKREIKNRSFLFALQLKPGEEKEIYLRIENHICIFPLYIGDMKAISEKQHPEDTFYGIFYGISFIIAFYALALFIASRETYYFYFFIQVIFFFLYGTIYCGDASQWFPAFALPLTDYGTVIISIGTIFVWLFFNSVLNTKKRIPVASSTFLISSLLQIISIPLYLVGLRSLAATINMVVAAAVFVAVVILCFYLKHEKIIRLIFIGFAVGFAIFVLWILMLQNIISYSRAVNNLFMIQYMWWMIIFSLALELNINNYIKEKYKAQKELLINLEEKERLILQQNEILEQKVEERTHALKETQSQLVQREKMASLGELTAGIAHEIQNPLNFVNNFSEVNKEMLEELKAERLKPNAERDDDLQNNLIDDVIANEEKINHHGKRADAIVKGMLQHSKQTKGIKEPTDINALCDEYLRLSYHGMRAKDKSFNADFKTDFDESIGKINIVPQDIGRVLLNLFNNAFYAVSKPPPPKGKNYQPLVSVTTRKIKLANNNVAKNTPSGDGGIEIVVSDNGNGIPQSIIDKIFQPFFTTKPTGEGTGLGLSLSYDIIKAHGGEIKVETKEAEGSEFIIQLPTA